MQFPFLFFPFFFPLLTMAKATLMIIPFDQNPREMEISEGVISIGRTADNTISFPTDSNVSRYHAEIEVRGDEFWLVELGSSNGTTVNNERVDYERILLNGDVITFGGSSTIEFYFASREKPVKNEPVVEPLEEEFHEEIVEEKPVIKENKSSSNVPIMLGVAAAFVGVAIVSVGALAYVFLPRSECPGTVKIVSPVSGSTISEPTDLQVQIKGAKCINRVAYLIDGEEIDSKVQEPFGTTLDPNKLSNFADSAQHILTVIVEDPQKNKVQQADQLLLEFRVRKQTTRREKEKEPPIDEPDEPDDEPTPKPKTSGTISIGDIQQMCIELAKQFPNGYIYKFDRAFLTQVQAKTNEFRSAGFSSRAQPYRDFILTGFVQEQGLRPVTAYLLAMSRSKFENKKVGNLEGLWQMSNEMATSLNYNQQCGGESLSDPKQLCAARVAAQNTRFLRDAFAGDLVFIAAFFDTPNEAAAFANTLPPERSEFWKLLKTQKQRDNVVRLFAAGIVAENPARFKLTSDLQLSSLYIDVR
jgi:pSer/pThr/pTyr-binding forkhead associated (FHA) protein